MTKIEVVVAGEIVSVTFADKVASCQWPHGSTQRYWRMPHETLTNFVGRIVRKLARMKEAP